MKKIIILGTGGNAIDIIDIIDDINEFEGTTQYECIGLLDDEKTSWGKTYNGFTVLGPLENADTFHSTYFINGIGNSQNFWEKDTIIAKTRVSLNKFETIIHPKASVSNTAKIGTGVVIFPNVTIANSVTIGNHVTIYPNAVISHDVVIGDYSIITSGVCISGGVKIGSLCYLGTNSSIKENLMINKYALIGMGSVVLKDVAEDNVVVGNPARPLRNTK